MRFIKLFEDFNEDDLVEEIEELFIEFTSDYDFGIEIQTEIYILKKDDGWSVPDTSRDNFQFLKSNVDYNLGFYVSIESPKIFEGDLTYEFQTIISQLGGMGWELAKIESQYPYQSNIGPESIKISSGGIKIGDRGALKLGLYFAGHETKKFTDVELVKYYKMSDWFEVDGKVFIEMDKRDLASLFIPEKSDYYSYLVDGDEINYHGWMDGYFPKPKDIANYYSDVSYENKEKLISIIIEECGGMEKFLSEFEDYLPSGEVDIPIIAKNGKGIDLEEIFKIAYRKFSKFSEILDKIINLIADWSCSAHEFQNSKEIDQGFERLLDKHITYTTSKKEVTAWKMVDSKKVTWEEEREFYQIKFDSDWLEDSKIDLGGGSLSEIFSEWCLETIGRVDINPRLSDYGSVDRESLNSEISDIIRS